MLEGGAAVLSPLEVLVFLLKSSEEGQALLCRLGDELSKFCDTSIETLDLFDAPRFSHVEQRLYLVRIGLDAPFVDEET